MFFCAKSTKKQQLTSRGEQHRMDTGTPSTSAKGGLTSLQADIARQIMVMINSNRWNVGSKVSDSQIARELGVSRTPVRQVLQSFETTGFIKVAEGRGFILARKPGADDDDSVDFQTSDNEALYEAIMSARAADEIGEDVSESQLVERFNTTRAAVRRALTRMAAEGLVDRRLGHGWQFAECLVTEQAVDESYEFRSIVECGALLTSGYNPDPTQLDALIRKQGEFMERPIAKIQRADWFDANAAFHETIVSWSGNRFLVQSVRRQNSLRRMTELRDFSHLSEQRLHEACADHLGILKEIGRGDYAFASALLGRHIRRAALDD